MASAGLERVSPNPMVGAVLVRGDRTIGSGFHQRFGGPHAEVEALLDARRRGESPRGADLYVTLEPCGHHGKTPPCAGAIIEAGVARVVYAVRDPNPLTRGVGPRLLRSAGISVVEGMLAKECAELNAPYFHWITTRRPWVILKWAMTLDGRTSTRDGESKWITGEAARARAHGLRRRVDAVLVGTETALRDDPLLTPRPSRGRRPWRIVLDRRGRLPLDLRLLSRKARETDGPRLYVTSSKTSSRRIERLEERGLRTLVLPERGGRLPLTALLRELGALEISQLLVEGGAALHGSFLGARLVQEVAAFVAPRVLGSLGARPAVEGSGLLRLGATPWLEQVRVEELGRDILIQGRIAPRNPRTRLR